MFTFEDLMDESIFSPEDPCSAQQLPLGQQQDISRDSEGADIMESWTSGMASPTHSYTSSSSFPPSLSSSIMTTNSSLNGAPSPNSISNGSTLGYEGGSGSSLGNAAFGSESKDSMFGDVESSPHSSELYPASTSSKHLPTPPLSSYASPPSPPPSLLTLPQSATSDGLLDSSPASLASVLQPAPEDLSAVVVAGALLWGCEDQVNGTPSRLDLSGHQSLGVQLSAETTSQEDAIAAVTAASSLAMQLAYHDALAAGSSLESAANLAILTAQQQQDLAGLGLAPIVSTEQSMAAIDGMAQLDVIMGAEGSDASIFMETTSTVPTSSLSGEETIGRKVIGPLTEQDMMNLFPHVGEDSITVQIISCEDEDEEGGRTGIKKRMFSSPRDKIKVEHVSHTKANHDSDDDDDLDIDDEEDEREREIRRAARKRLSSFLLNGEPHGGLCPAAAQAALKLVEQNKIDIKIPSLLGSLQGTDGILAGDQMFQQQHTFGNGVGGMDSKKRARAGSVSSIGLSALSLQEAVNARRRSSTSFSPLEHGSVTGMFAGKSLIHHRLQVLTGASTPILPTPMSGVSVFNVQNGGISPISPTDTNAGFSPSVFGCPSSVASSNSNATPVFFATTPTSNASLSGSVASSPVAPSGNSQPIRCLQVSPPPVTPPSNEVIEYSEVEDGSDDEDSDEKGYFPPITYSRNCQVRPKEPAQQYYHQPQQSGRRGSVSKRHHPYKDYALANSEGFGADGYVAVGGSKGSRRASSSGAARRRKSAGASAVGAIMDPSGMNTLGEFGTGSSLPGPAASNSRKAGSGRTTMNSSSSVVHGSVDASGMPIVGLEGSQTVTPTPSPRVVSKPPKKQPQLPAHCSSRPVPDSKNLFERTYSSVSVYEMNANGTSIMRRLEDGWINATHLLKVAGFIDKAKRTKVLEKEIHSGIHEKIQGGYGRYQGTWVPLERAKSLATKFEVYEVLKEILDR
ncbi:hypothetical protein HDU97_000557 [Phlyctochytrium planicorne]|nr:hypothetical protein HDU97_000557 [Phlyctochytrium planicorne]